MIKNYISTKQNTFILLSYATLILLAALWWFLNLPYEPKYGDTVEYWSLAKTLQVDSWRTLAYPLILRWASYFSSIVNPRIIVYLLQSLLAFIAAYYFFATFDHFMGIKKKQNRHKRLVLSVVLISLPLITHFMLTVLTDSLAASFFIIGIMALARSIILTETSVATLSAMVIGVAGSGFIRPERLVIFLLIAVIAIFWFILKRKAKIAITMVMLVILIFMVTLVNEATQNADLGRPRLSVEFVLFDRALQGQFTTLYPQMPDTIRKRVSSGQARDWDHDPNEYQFISKALDDHDGHIAMQQAIFIALRYDGFRVLEKTIRDFLENLLSPINYIRESFTGAPNTTTWTNTRMEEAHPRLTRIFLGYSFALTIGLLVLFVFQIKEFWDNRDSRNLLVFLGFAIALLSAMYALHSGLGFHIRYALPIYVLEMGPLLWLASVLKNRMLFSH